MIQDDPYDKLCVPDVVKNVNVKVFNFMQRINETRQIIWHESCKCIYRSTSSGCNTRQTFNKDRCRCECKEDLINNEVCDIGFASDPSKCQCQCNKWCGIRKYLDYMSCVCRNSIVDKLVEQCTNVIDENKVYNETLNTISSDECASCILHFVLFAVFLTSVIIGSSFIYFY